MRKFGILVAVTSSFSAGFIAGVSASVVLAATGAIAMFNIIENDTKRRIIKGDYSSPRSVKVTDE